MNTTRTEPKVSMPDETDAAAAPKEMTVEDLVPGLDEEIERQESAADEPEENEADRVIRLIADLEAERDEMRDSWKRALAEAENVRRRAERDRKDAETYGGTKLARDLLAVYDSLDRALKAADDDLREQAGPFIEGIDLTQRELLKAFEKHKIAAVTPAVGERFDPNRHQAMFEAPIPGAEAGAIIEVMQDGFVIADRLLRPALVGVAKAAPEPAAAPETSPTSDTEKES